MLQYLSDNTFKILHCNVKSILIYLFNYFLYNRNREQLRVVQGYRILRYVSFEHEIKIQNIKILLKNRLLKIKIRK